MERMNGRMRDLSGQTFGSYRLEGLLGRGGMGEVYRAQHLRLTGRLAAVKILPASFAAEADFLRRFEQEANSAASLDHPNILPVWDYGEQDGMPYLAMPLVPAGSLKELLERHGPLAPTEAERYLTPIANALDYAHSRGILHRDVKPANILLREDGRPQLADFGIAKAIEDGQTQGLTQAGGGIGTPEYMAPEQIEGRAEPRSDFYALGISLYQMLSGQLPYDGATPYEVALKQLSNPPPPIRRVRPDLSPAIEAVLQRSLAKDPAARYSSGRAFADAFHEAIVRPNAVPALLPIVSDQRTIPLSAVPVSAAAVSQSGRTAVYVPPPVSPPQAYLRPPASPGTPSVARRGSSGLLLAAALIIAVLLVGIGGLIAYSTLFGAPPPPTPTVAVIVPPVDPTLTAVASGNATTVAGINATATTLAAQGATATASADAAQAAALAAENATVTAQAAAAATERANAAATASAASAQTATAAARASATAAHTPTATAVPPTNTAVPPTVVPPTAPPPRAPTVAPTAAGPRPSTAAWGPALAPLSGGKRYTDPGKRFAVSVPNPWVQNQSGADQVGFAPPDNAANFAVALMPVADPTTLDTYNAAVEQQVRSQLTGYKAVRLDKVVLDGRQAYKRVSRGTAQGQNLQVAQFYFLDTGTAHLLTFVTRAENFDRFAVTFDGIAGSYTVGP